MLLGEGHAFVLFLEGKVKEEILLCLRKRIAYKIKLHPGLRGI